MGPMVAAHALQANALFEIVLAGLAKRASCAELSAVADTSTKKPTWCLTSESDLAYQLSYPSNYQKSKDFFILT